MEKRDQVFIEVNLIEGKTSTLAAWYSKEIKSNDMVLAADFIGVSHYTLSKSLLNIISQIQTKLDIHEKSIAKAQNEIAPSFFEWLKVASLKDKKTVHVTSNTNFRL